MNVCVKSGNINNFLNRFNYCHCVFMFSHHNLTVWWVTDHSMCRCGSTPGSELSGYEGPQVHAGSWERWGHFPPPGCPGYVGKEEACLSNPPYTPEANQTYIRNNRRFRFSENNDLSLYVLKLRLCVSVSNNVLSHLPVWDEAPSLLLCNLWWSPRPSIPPRDLGSKPEWTETQIHISLKLWNVTPIRSCTLKSIFINQMWLWVKPASDRYRKQWSPKV